MLNATNVNDISKSLQRFSWPDYLVFVLMLLSCIFIGIYFGYKDHQKHKKHKNTRRGSEALDYLVGGRKMKIFPVSMSLVASWISGISLLGTSTEIYVYGTQYCYIFIAIILMGFIMYYIYLPVFHELQITSTYEYFQLRFDKRVRLFGSILYTVGTVLWLPIVIYVPALAFNQVTGVNIHVITPIVCLVCIFYTCVGGMKAVVWTDVIQTVIMAGALLLVILIGTSKVGGLSVVLKRNYESGRIEAPILDFNPTTRHTLFTMAIGGTFYMTSTIACCQSMVQRYLSLPTLKAARQSSILFAIGLISFLGACFYNGMLIYATYHDCDPLTTGLARAKDQLVPLLVMDVLGDYFGLSGMFVAGVFSAALSSLSTALNSLSAIVLEDFLKPFLKKPLTNQQERYVMRGTVFVFGMICLLMVLMVERLGTVLQLNMSLGGITSGPLLALFTIGVLMPWVNGTGALVGGITGLIMMGFICFKAQASIAMGEIVFKTKPVSTEHCLYDFNMANKTEPAKSFEDLEKSIHHISYLYYTIFGTIVSCIVANIVSLLTSSKGTKTVDSSLIAPCIRKYFTIPPEIEEKQGKEIIYHFEMKENS